MTTAAQAMAFLRQRTRCPRAWPDLAVEGGYPPAQHLDAAARSQWFEGWRETVTPRPEVFYWRTAAGIEVDLIIERRRRTLPIEVKSTSRIRGRDAAGVESFLGQHPSAPWGLVIHTGADLHLVSPRVVAVPLNRLLG